MGTRFHRSKKLFPGVRLNISKSGFGLSFGRKGARFSIGPKGTRTTLGIPGTGLSYISQSSSKNDASLQNLSVDNVSDVNYDVNYLLADPVFRELGDLADINPKKALSVYTSVIGFVKDDKEHRVFKDTGEIYVPSEGQLAVEKKLYGLWKQYKIDEYNKYHISPWDYLGYAVFIGYFSGHRYAANQIDEAVIRFILIIGALMSPIPTKYVFIIFWLVAILESVMTFLFAKEDKRGRVKPLNLLDIINILAE